MKIIDNVTSFLYFDGKSKSGKMNKYSMLNTNSRNYVQFVAKNHQNALNKFFKYEYVSSGCIINI